MRTRLPLLIAVAAALAAPATAGAGGFATVGVNPLPEGIDPGEPWNVELTVLQHGRTPLEGVHPRVIATRGSERREFAARATDRPGVYSAEVVFPDAGNWNYVVDDGFTQTHSFPPVTVGGGAAAPAPTTSADDGPDILLALAAAALAGLVAALGSTALRRRRPATEGG